MKKPFYEITKRGFDIISSLIAIIVLSPVWIICIIGIKVSSKGPVFYTSTRAGRNSRPFTMYKFRSMHLFIPQAEGQKSERKFVNNARVFRFGSFIRKAKLDELPQLLNILQGQMSVVGPRPILMDRATKDYVGKYSCIAEVKPGLACLDSLFDYAHGDLFVTDNDEYMRNILPVRRELARMYVEKRGIGIDLYCIFRTVKLILEIAVLKKREFPYTRYEAQAREGLGFN
ncbi:MAG: sugar transferase [Lachnospiraceae bacterium]